MNKFINVCNAKVKKIFSIYWLWTLSVQRVFNVWYITFILAALWIIFHGVFFGGVGGVVWVFFQTLVSLMQIFFRKTRTSCLKHEQETGLVHVYVLLTYLTRPRLDGVVIPKESMGAIAETENHIDLFIFFF